MNLTASGPRESLFLPPETEFLAPVVVSDLIRVGSPNDGGYVLPRSVVTGAEFLVSMGLNEDWSFDEHLQQLNPSIGIHAYDHTISRALFRKRLISALLKLPVGRSTFSYIRERIRVLRAYEGFFRPPVAHYEQRVFNRIETARDARLEDIFARIDSNKVLLKIDIEGAEYRIIGDILRFSDRIVGMVMEFHDTEPLRPVFLEAVRKLQRRFAIVHLHGNNHGSLGYDGLPESLEITFVPLSAVYETEKRTMLPLPEVDSPNKPGKPDYILRFAGAISGKSSTRPAASHQGPA